MCILKISLLDGGDVYVTPNVFSVPKTPVKPNFIPSCESFKNITHLRDIAFPHANRVSVTLHTGAYVLRLLCPVSTRKSKLGKSVALEIPIQLALIGAI